MLTLGVVPRGFGCGLPYHIPKCTNRTISACGDDFRIITIFPIFSNIFEHCILAEISPLPKSHTRQFGFKKDTGCNHATFILKCTVDYFTSMDSNVNVAVLDLSKAFNKVNHFALFDKLFRRGVPTCNINILLNWFNVTTTCVMWNGFIYTTLSLFALVLDRVAFLVHIFFQFLLMICLCY